MIHCYKCGRFVGKDGFIDISPNSDGFMEEGNSECKRCLDLKRRKNSGDNHGRI